MEYKILGYEIFIGDLIHGTRNTKFWAMKVLIVGVHIHGIRNTILSAMKA